jgi:hypothetical protein
VPKTHPKTAVSLATTLSDSGCFILPKCYEILRIAPLSALMVIVDPGGSPCYQQVSQKQPGRGDAVASFGRNAPPIRGNSGPCGGR